MAKQRVFLAIQPQKTCLMQMMAIQKVLGQLWEKARWLEPDQIHMTLHFLGHLGPAKIDALKSALVEVKGEGGAQPLDHFQAFPSLDRTKVLALACKEPVPALAKLYGDIDKVLEGLEIQTEERPLYPHLSLARFNPPVRLKRTPPFPSNGAKVVYSSFSLYASHLEPEGAKYEIIQDFPLVSP